MTAKLEVKVVTQIRGKMINNNGVIAKAGKGNSIVIMYRSDYEQKVLNFISCNGANETNDNVTNVFQKELRHTLSDCKQMVYKTVTSGDSYI
jgi:hypothetical protein